MDHRALGGYLDICGNMAMFGNGLVAHLHGNEIQRSAGKDRMYTGLASNGSAILLARYGEQSVDRQFERVHDKLALYLQKQGVPLDAKSLKAASAEQRRGWFRKTEDFCYNHISEVNNVFIALSSLGMLRSGIKRFKNGEKITGVGNASMSILTMVAALTSCIIPEETAEQVAAKGQSQTLWGKLKQHPLSLATAALVASDITEGVNSFGEQRTARKAGGSYGKSSFVMSGLSALTMGFFVAGDTMTGAGSKLNGGEAKDREKAQKQMVKEAAAILACLPPEKRQELIKQTAEYMVKQPELRMVNLDPAKLQQDILAAIQAQTAVDVSEGADQLQSDWVERTGAAPTTEMLNQTSSDKKYTQLIDTKRAAQILPPVPTGVGR